MALERPANLTHAGCLTSAGSLPPPPPRIRLEPSAWHPGLGWPWGPHGSMPGLGSMRQLPSPGAPWFPQDRGVLALEVMAHQGPYAF